MGLKEWLQKIQPTPLHVILVLSILHFLAQLVICHVTHALTLLLDSCHMLCNIIALIGCLITLKYDDSKQPISATQNKSNTTENVDNENNSEVTAIAQSAKDQVKSLKRSRDEKRLRNTFGWARIEVLTMLVVCVFFASLCLSVIMESIQTLVHIGHLDAIHNPLVVFTMGAIGLCLNGFCYLLIGGYTFHQGSFIQITSSGCVVLEGVITADSIRQGQRRLSRSKRPSMMPKKKQRQGFVEALRDILSCFFVMACAMIVYLIDPRFAKYVDPAIAILSSFLLLSLTYPYIKESGMILLQTIPDAMDIEILKKELLIAFPIIVNVHDFHIWQLNTSSVILTVHITFPGELDYVALRDNIKKFFLEEGITQVTIQPEFYSSGSDAIMSPIKTCLMPCIQEECMSKHCCTIVEDPTTKLLSVEVPSSQIDNTGGAIQGPQVNGIKARRRRRNS